MNRLSVAVFLSTGMVAAPASAGLTLFEQLPTLFDGLAADMSGINPTQIPADGFSVGFDAQIQTVEFWGFYLPLDLADPTSLDNFTITIYGDDNGVPGDVLYTEMSSSVTAVETGALIAGVATQYLYSFDLASDVGINAGDTYYFSVLNDTGLGAPGGSSGTWGWELAGTDGDGGYLSYDGGNFWAPNGPTNLTFRIIGVPSPTGVALFSAAGLALARRRR